MADEDRVRVSNMFVGAGGRRGRTAEEALLVEEGMRREAADIRRQWMRLSAAEGHVTELKGDLVKTMKLLQSRKGERSLSEQQRLKVHVQGLESGLLEEEEALKSRRRALRSQMARLLSFDKGWLQEHQAGLGVVGEGRRAVEEVLKLVLICMGSHGSAWGGQPRAGDEGECEDSNPNPSFCEASMLQLVTGVLERAGEGSDKVLDTQTVQAMFAATGCMLTRFEIQEELDFMAAQEPRGIVDLAELSQRLFQSARQRRKHKHIKNSKQGSQESGEGEGEGGEGGEREEIQGRTTEKEKKEATKVKQEDKSTGVEGLGLGINTSAVAQPPSYTSIGHTANGPNEQVMEIGLSFDQGTGAGTGTGCPAESEGEVMKEENGDKNRANGNHTRSNEPEADVCSGQAPGKRGEALLGGVPSIKDAQGFRHRGGRVGSGGLDPMGRGIHRMPGLRGRAEAVGGGDPEVLPGARPVEEGTKGSVAKESDLGQGSQHPTGLGGEGGGGGGHEGGEEGYVVASPGDSVGAAAPQGFGEGGEGGGRAEYMNLTRSAVLVVGEGAG
ncbi:unnamed protein product, partial [Discosporangium mesarthrocarpum]